MKSLWASLTVLSLTACSAESTPTHSPAFDLPPDLYSTNELKSSNESILHPAGYLERLNTKAETDCDREALRKLVIAMNMYSYDQMNQSYYINIDSSGGKILLEAFPAFKTMTNSEVIHIEKMSNHLRTISIPCD